MAHALTPYLGPGDLDSAAFAYFSFKADFLVLSAVALPILCRAKNAFTEKAVPFGFKGAVIYGLGLFDLSVRPLTDHLGRCKADFYRFKCHISHYFFSLPYLSPFSGKLSSSKPPSSS